MNRLAPLGRLAMFATPVVLCAAAVFPAYMNHDAAWYLHMAAVWLDGGTLYRDVFDTNPPLIVFLTAVPVWVARVTSLPTPAVFTTAVLVLAAAAVAMARRPISRAWHSESSRLLMALVLLFALFPFVGSEFGQREHLAAILVAPYVLQACAWAPAPAGGRDRGVPAGILAGLGFTIKPHFALAWIAAEGAVALLQPRSASWRRPAALAALATMVAYALIVVILVPDYVPLAREVMQVYGGWNPPPATLLRVPELRLWLVAVAALLLVRLPAAHRAPPVVLCLVSTGFLAAAMLQLKGWDYHFYPCRVFLLLFFAALAGGVAEAHAAVPALIRGGARTLSAAAFVLIVVSSTRAIAEARRRDANSTVASLVRLIDRPGNAESLAMLSMRNMIVPAFPAVTYTHVRWVLRHNGLWFLPGLYAEEVKSRDGAPQFRARTQMPALERRFFDQVVDDLCAIPPRLLLIEPPARNSASAAGSLDLLSYYRQDPRVARLLEAYEPIDTIGAFDVYRRAADVSCNAQQP